jgi:hypothetical protein
MIPGFGNVIAVLLKIIEKGQDQPGGKVIQSERGDFDAMVFCGEREEKLKGIPIPLDGMRTGSLDVREVPVKKLMEQGGQFHRWSIRDLEKEISPATCFASDTFR